MAAISAELGIPTVCVAAPEYVRSSIHAPNEHIRLDDYRACLRYWGRLFDHLGRQTAGK